MTTHFKFIAIKDNAKRKDLSPIVDGLPSDEKAHSVKYIKGYGVDEGTFDGMKVEFDLYLEDEDDQNPGPVLNYLQQIAEQDSNGRYALFAANENEERYQTYGIDYWETVYEYVRAEKL